MLTHSLSLVCVLAIVTAVASRPAPHVEVARASAIKRSPLARSTASRKRYSSSISDRRDWRKAQSAKLRNRYGSDASDAALVKRRVANESLDDLGADTEWVVQMDVGTPPQSFYVQPDTGSADLWLVGSECDPVFCSGDANFDTSRSSTFHSTGTPFNITYGIGGATGTDATDTISLAGFTVPDQGFAVVTNGTDLGLAPQAGILGLAWSTLATSGFAPMWQTLASSGQLDSPAFSFYFARYQGNLTATAIEADGGEFTLGGNDTSRYNGSINYISYNATDEDYWRIPVQNVTVLGAQIQGVTNREAAIDTGTSLIGAPTADVKRIYSQIPGSHSLDGTQDSGYYVYFCNATVNLQLGFGGQMYNVSDADFNLGEYDAQDFPGFCVGAIFEINTGSRSPIKWVVGDTFLKNVYSVFRYDPPAIGFGLLA